MAKRPVLLGQDGGHRGQDHADRDQGGNGVKQTQQVGAFISRKHLHEEVEADRQCQGGEYGNQQCTADYLLHLPAIAVPLGCGNTGWCGDAQAQLPHGGEGRDQRLGQKKHAYRSLRHGQRNDDAGQGSRPKKQKTAKYSGNTRGNRGRRARW
ncbi:hypothetical protein OGV25_05955 [Pseudomonas sp. P1B16]|uniref:hypothetical protein n=1 Tax=Pseudomonas sp. P1B16 TaxID=2986074 RepID=UPI002A2466C5|nr:hypothetical protein [Pseudomonas sp. P1B16]WPM27781.1 hypothetical protein OGV25_05955 [Pseudomonas sp. P1B16]